MQKYILNHPEKRKKSYTDYAIKNIDIIKRKREMLENKLKKRNCEIKKCYGLTLLQVEEMKKSQDDKCAICGEKFGKSKNTHIDHCHKTKIVRGILCQSCNLGIGFFKDDIKRLNLAINYLKKHARVS